MQDFGKCLTNFMGGRSEKEIIDVSKVIVFWAIKEFFWRALFNHKTIELSYTGLGIFQPTKHEFQNWGNTITIVTVFEKL